MRQNPHTPVPAEATCRGRKRLSYAHFTVVADRQARRAGPTCSPCAASSHESTHSTTTTSNPSACRSWRKVLLTPSPCSNPVPMPPRNTSTSPFVEASGARIWKDPRAAWLTCGQVTSKSRLQLWPCGQVDGLEVMATVPSGYLAPLGTAGDALGEGEPVGLIGGRPSSAGRLVQAARSSPTTATAATIGRLRLRPRVRWVRWVRRMGGVSVLVVGVSGDRVPSLQRLRHEREVGHEPGHLLAAGLLFRRGRHWVLGDELRGSTLDASRHVVRSPVYPAARRVHTPVGRKHYFSRDGGHRPADPCSPYGHGAKVAFARPCGRGRHRCRPTGPTRCARRVMFER